MILGHVINLWVVIFSMVIVAIEGYISWEEKTFNQEQIKRFWLGALNKRTQPFNTHGGMWSDFGVLPWIFGASAIYAHQWNICQVVGAYIFSGVITVVAHDSWAVRDCIGCHCIGRRKYTLAGLIHAMYMQAALTDIILLFFCTKGMTNGSALLISAALVLHIFLGMVQPSLVSNKGRMDKNAWVGTLVSLAALVPSYFWLNGSLRQLFETLLHR